MQGQAGRLAEALEAVREHLGRERTDPLVREAEVGHAEGPRGDVDDGTGEGFVEGRVGGAEAAEPRAGAERGADGRAEREKGVFCRVVVVDCMGVLDEVFVLFLLDFFGRSKESKILE